MNKASMIAVGVAIIVVIAAGVYLFTRHVPAATSTTASTTGNTPAASSTAAASTNTAGNTAAATVPAPVAPKSYERALVFPASISGTEKTAIQAQFDKDIQTIKTNGDINAWADLAVLRKITGDYAGSAELWLYISGKYPDLDGPYASLGDLYANYLHDYAKAEADYLKVLSIDPRSADTYVALATLYRGPYPKTNTAAEDILKKGIAAIPASYQLQIELARYYASKGRTADAKAAYEAAIANARAQNKPDIASQIATEEQSI